MAQKKRKSQAKTAVGSVERKGLKSENIRAKNMFQQCGNDRQATDSQKKTP